MACISSNQAITSGMWQAKRFITPLDLTKKIKDKRNVVSSTLLDLTKWFEPRIHIVESGCPGEWHPELVSC